MTFPVFSCLTTEPARVSEACFSTVNPSVDPVSRAELHAHPARSLLLNWVSHLSQAMGKLKYTLFYMGFVLKKKIDANSKVRKVQPASVGTGVWLPLNADRGSLRNRSSNHACPAAVCHHHLLPVSGQSHQGKGEEASSATAPPGAGTRGTGLCVWPRFRTRPFPFPLDFLSHSLRFTGKQH